MTEQKESQISLPISKPPTAAFTIEGNIGCGKSTFLKVVQKYFPELVLIEEPVDEWQNLAGKGLNMLEKYYKESTRWGYTFLNYAAFSRARRFVERKGHTGIYTLSERSILSDKHIFGPLMADLRFMDESQYILFQQMYKGYEEMMRSSMPKVIYLQCCPKVCSERTKKRQRTEEESIPFSYFQKLHELHEIWMRSSQKNEMLVVNTSEDFENNPQLVEDMVVRLSKFIYGEKLSEDKKNMMHSQRKDKRVLEKVSIIETKKEEEIEKTTESCSSSEENIENQEGLKIQKQQSLKGV